MKRAARIERRNRIICAYAIALGDNFANPLPPTWAACAVRAVMPDVSTQEIADAVAWSLRESKRGGQVRARTARASQGVRQADFESGGMNALLAVLIVGIVMLALAIDVGALVGWCWRRR